MSKLQPKVLIKIIFSEDEKFETFTKDILKYFDENLSKGRTDSIDYERVLSSLTASTSASSTSSASTTASTSKSSNIIHFLV